MTVMSDQAARVTCIGLANVDVIASVDESFITGHHIARKASTLLDAGTTGSILSKLGNPAFYPGGCAANTACGLAGLDIEATFVGKTGDDIYAKIFRQGFKNESVCFTTPPFTQKMTSTCLTLVTPDKDRSFAFCTDTAGWYLSPADLPDLPGRPDQYVYLESNTAKMPTGGPDNVLDAAVEKYGNTGIKIIVNLNDRAIVQSAKPVLTGLLKKDIAFFIGNIDEVYALFDTTDEKTALARALETGRNFAITDGPNGVSIVSGGKIIHLPAIPVDDSLIVNTVGAGDQFAAGFIAGLAWGLDVTDACQTGIETATNIIQEVSARPLKSGART